MYRTEDFTEKLKMEDYNNNYVNSEGFLEYCQKHLGYDPVWSCPQYDFDPDEYGREFKYFHIIGTRIIFEPTAGREEREKNEIGRSVKQACLKEKDILSEKLKTLERKYPGSLGMSAGSCHMCSQCIKPRRGGCRYPDEIRYLLEAMEGVPGRTAGELLGNELQLTDQAASKSFTVITALLTDHSEVEI